MKQMKKSTSEIAVVLLVYIAVGCSARAIGFDEPLTKSALVSSASKKAAQNNSVKPPGKLVTLNKQATVLLDVKGKRLLLKTKVVLREGVLEMFCCLIETKEHESILAVDAKAYEIHAGLLALKAKPGSPVRFQPKYQPPKGQRIDIFVQWKDKNGKLHRVRGQEWVRYVTHRFYVAEFNKLPDDLEIPKETKLVYDAKFDELSWYGPMSLKQRDKFLALSKDKKYRKAIETFYKQSQPRHMNGHWVFAGSGFFIDKASGRRFYQAEGGQVICVANFGSAMIDITIPSTDSDEELLFEPYTERIPPLGTEVTVELVPVFEKPGKTKKSRDNKKIRGGKK